MAEAYIGMGSNLGNREAWLRHGVRQMVEQGLTVEAGSAAYQSAPVGNTDQPDFLNAAVRVESKLGPRDLLNLLLECEAALGRVRHIRWGPRTLDLDLLLFGQEIVDEEGLSVPHPRLHERPFVLLPLCDLNPLGRHPVLGQTFKALLDLCPDAESVRRADEVDLMGS